ncbi:MAG: hypothetical protein GY788_05360 [bacterium]|nr:hypothetical protein [bacterium]
MANNKIDVPLGSALEKYLEHPPCADLGFLEPKSQSVKLPTGRTLKGVVDITKSIPDDCSLSFSLVLQLAPFLANLECLLKLLDVIQPLANIVKNLASPDKKEVKNFGTAASVFVECLTDFTGGIPTFLKDILCLIVKILRCMIQQQQSLLNLMGGLSLQMQEAAAAGNTGLMASLECARQNASMSAAHSASAIEPVLVLLALIKPLFGFIPDEEKQKLDALDGITIPTIGSTEDVEEMNEHLDKLRGVVDAIELVAMALPEPGPCT